MKLYHGTKGTLFDKIVLEGLKPRGKRRGNWQHTVSSHPDGVYLTQTYAPYFCHEFPKGCVIEIETDRLDEFDLLPDEDALGHQDPHKVGGDVVERARHYRDRIMEWEDGRSWERSLAYLGTCMHYGTIPPRAFTRAVVWDTKPNSHLRFIFDPAIVPMNYRIMAGRYRALMQVLFRDPIDVELTQFERIAFDPRFPMYGARLYEFDSAGRYKARALPTEYPHPFEIMTMLDPTEIMEGPGKS